MTNYSYPPLLYLQARWCKAKLVACRGAQVHFRSNTTPANHVTNICCSVALYFLLWTFVDCCREPLLVRACHEWLKHATLHACEILRDTVRLWEQADLLPLSLIHI